MHDVWGEPPPDPGMDQLARIVARRADPTGAADALCMLYAVHGLPILRYLYFLTEDHGYDEELNQDVFLAVWNGAASFDGRAVSTRSWPPTSPRRTRAGSWWSSLGPLLGSPLSPEPIGGLSRLAADGVEGVVAAADVDHAAGNRRGCGDRVLGFEAP